MSVNIHVKIIKGSNLLKMDVGKSDPYVVVTLNGKEQKQKTQAISNTLEPLWNQEFDLVSKKPKYDQLCIEVFDEDMAKDDPMCDKIKIKVSEIPKDGSIVTKKESLKLKKKDAGILEFEYSATPGAADDSEKKKKDKKKDKKKEDSSSSKDKKKKNRRSTSESNDKKKDKPIPPTKYKLNIRCMRAENIPKADISKSDPYAVFNLDGYDLKAQTNYIENTLNPEWNEDLCLDGYALSEDVLCVTLWDKDIKKDDKLCGCEITLRDIQPVGFVITDTFDLYKLDKKGRVDKKKKAGKITLGLQIARESDTPFEEIEWEYPIYVANIHIVQCEDVPPMDIKSSDPYCILTFNDKSKKSKTKVIENCLNPQWDEKFHWYYEDNSVQNIIHVSLWDKDVSKDDQISKLDVDASKCKLGIIYECKQTLHPVGKKQKGGDLSYRLHITKLGEIAFDDENIENDQDEDCYTLNLLVVQAKDLPKADANDTDGYVKVTVDDNEQMASTKPQKNTLNPVWKEHIQWKPCYDDSKVRIELWDKDLMMDDKLDEFEINMTDFPLGTVQKKWFDFPKQGKIELWIHLTRPDQKPFENDAEEASSSMKTCSFSWGSYSSSEYSTDFDGYTEGYTISSLHSSEEKKIIHKHEIKEKKHKEHKPRKDCILKIISADGLFIPEVCKGAIQPYATVRVAGRKAAKKTSVKDFTLNPEWNEELHVKKVEASDSIEITLFDKNVILKDQPLGYVLIPLAEIYDNDSEIDNTYDLVKPPQMSDEVAAFVQNGFGHIHISVSFK